MTTAHERTEVRLAELPPRLLLPEEAAAYLRISETKLRQLTNEGRVPAVDGIGKGLLWDKQDLDRVIDEWARIRPTQLPKDR